MVYTETFAQGVLRFVQDVAGTAFAAGDQMRRQRRFRSAHRPNMQVVHGGDAGNCLQAVAHFRQLDVFGHAVEQEVQRLPEQGPGADDDHGGDHQAGQRTLRAVIHLRSYAQKKPIDEYKQEAFLLFERLLIAIREDVTKTLSRAQIQLAEPALPVLPDFITNHIDPLSGDDDSADIDAATGAVMSRLPSMGIPEPDFPSDLPETALAEPISRNALCPCGSGRKFKHCHGQIA